MPRRDDAPRDLLFGLLALQNALVTRDQLVPAFAAWTASPGKPWPTCWPSRVPCGPSTGRLLDALVDAHLKLHGGDPERSLAALDVDRSTRESLAAAGGPDRGHARPRRLRLGRPTATPTAPPATPSARPPPTASGSASSGPTPGAAWAPSSSPSTPSCTARWPSSRSSTSTPTTRPAAQRFLLEAEITGGLEHPGIVPVYGLGTYGDGRPYYAMRFIRGDSLKEAIERFHADESLQARPRPPVAGAAQAAAAVHRRLQRDRLRPQPRRAAPRHQAGQRHRRQARRDAGGRLGPGQAAGPGRARRRRRRADADARPRPAASAETLPGSALGTPAYMSPEQAARRPRAARAAVATSTAWAPRSTAC